LRKISTTFNQIPREQKKSSTEQKNDVADFQKQHNPLLCATVTVLGEFYTGKYQKINLKRYVQVILLHANPFTNLQKPMTLAIGILQFDTNNIDHDAQ